VCFDKTTTSSSLLKGVKSGGSGRTSHVKKIRPNNGLPLIQSITCKNSHYNLNTGKQSSSTARALLVEVASSQNNMPPFAPDASMTMILTSSLRTEKADSDNNAITKVHCVCFDMEPDMYFIEQLEELDHGIVEALWYGDEEMELMMADALTVLEGKNKVDLPRGLEHCTYEGQQRRRLERSKASEAVLGEQLRQQAAKALHETVYKDSDELIAKEYHKVSRKQQELAYKRGLSDAAEASDKLLARPLSLVKTWWFRSDRHLVSPL
jgi:hypothetical protein